MSRPLLLIAPAIIAGTAVGHLVFYEWNLGSYAAGSIVVMWGGLILLTLAAWLLHKHADNRRASWGFVLVTALFFVLVGTLRYAHFTAQRWPAWAEMKARLDRPINRGNPDEFDYEQWLWVQEKRIAADGWTVIDAPRPLDSLRSRALRLRGRLIQRYAEAGLEGDTLALISAMTLADRSHLSTVTRTLYAEAGASHLLALSGLHLGIIVGLLTWLFGGFRMRWSRWRLPAIAAIIPLVWGYAFVTGLPPSLVRAALMSTVFFVTMALERDADGVNSLLLTVAVMLLWRPTYLFDVGAQLSVMAVLGICLFYGPVTRWFISTHKAAYLRLKRWHLAAPLQLMLVSFSAQLLTMPLVGHYFHQIAPWGALFSLFYIPLTTLIIYGSLLLLLVPSGLLGKGITLLVAAQSMLMHAEQQLPLARVSDFWSAKAEPGLVIYNNPRCPAIHLIASSSESWMLLSDSARVAPEEGLRYIASSFWKKRNFTPPTLLRGQHTLQGCGFSVALLDTDLRRWSRERQEEPHASPAHQAPTSIDVLVLVRGFRGRLSAVAETILPRLVVLDASLPSWQVKQLEAEAARMGWPAWNIRKRGALYLKAPTTSPPSSPPSHRSR